MLGYLIGGIATIWLSVKGVHFKYLFAAGFLLLGLSAMFMLSLIHILLHIQIITIYFIVEHTFRNIHFGRFLDVYKRQILYQSAAIYAHIIYYYNLLDQKHAEQWLRRLEQLSEEHNYYRHTSEAKR